MRAAGHAPRLPRRASADRAAAGLAGRRPAVDAPSAGLQCCRPGSTRPLAAAVLGLLLTLAPARAAAQPAEEGMPVKDVQIRGLSTISEGFVRRLVRTRAGQPLRLEQVREDVRALLRSRKFVHATADTRVEDGQAVVVFLVQEKPEIRAVEVVGNRELKTDELLRELSFAAGGVLDRYEIDRGREAMLRKYREKGYLYAEVALDEAALAEENRVVYRISEGPRVRVRKVRFEGVRSFPEGLLRGKVRTQTWLWPLRSGAFDDEQAQRDALELQTFYREEGFLDARAGYRVDFEDIEQTRAVAVFVVEEGDRYRIREIEIEGNEVFDDARIAAVMRLRPGDFFREEARRADQRRIEDLYGEIGYIDARVAIEHRYLEEPGLVDVRVEIREGERSTIGRIDIRGNQTTRDEVVRRELRFYPGEDFNVLKTRRAERRLIETTLFSRATITPLERAPEGQRDVLVEVEEADAIQFLVGIGVSTDSGVLGSITLENRNFDLLAWPRDWRQFFQGRAFRGAGQRLRLQAEPGSELSRFRIDFTEPWLLDRPLRLDSSVYLFQRDRGEYDEQRVGFTPGLSHRFEGGPLDAWAVEGALRVEGVDISDVGRLRARDIRRAEGSSFLTSVKGSLVRDTTDSRFFPTEGYRLNFSWEQVGALGGDFTFGKPTLGASWFQTLRTDVYERKSVLGLRADAGWIVGDAPVFERFYAGGFGSMRGFEYRGISPRAGLRDDRVGGDFILLTGAEYSFPLYGKNIRGVTFLDMGTVERDFEITTWRAAVGVGLRINVDFFGPIPMVLDFGIPIARDDDDDTEVFNFSFGASF